MTQASRAVFNKAPTHHQALTETTAPRDKAPTHHRALTTAPKALEETSAQEEQAATAIQAAFRGHRERKSLKASGFGPAMKSGTSKDVRDSRFDLTFVLIYLVF
jgi:hypothetical protein